MSAMARTERGFTLLELLVAMAISAVILTSVVLVGNAQVRAYAVGARQRVAQAQGRGALLYVEDQVARAGYGVEPAFAFDFNRYAGPCPAELAPCPRDSASNSDELVFYARNPNYWVPGDGNGADPSGNAWAITATTPTSVSVRARPTDVFRMGQVVLEVCRGASVYAYATVAATTPPGSTQVTLQPAVAADPFNRPDLAVPPATGASCFTNGQGRLFLIDRFRFHVRPVTVDGNVIPYLMLDQGVDRNGDGVVDSKDELVIAEGVENLQVGYVMASSALPTPVVGSVPTGNPITTPVAPPGDLRAAPATAGSSTTANELTLTVFPGAAPAFGESVYAPSSWTGLTVGPPPSPQRLTDHQANIVGVRIALVTRSAATDLTSPGDTFQPLNMTADPAWVTAGQIAGRDGYQRALFTSTVMLPNMTVGGLTYF